MKGSKVEFFWGGDAKEKYFLTVSRKKEKSTNAELRKYIEFFLLFQKK